MEGKELEKNGTVEWTPASWLTRHDLDGTHHMYSGALGEAVVPSKDDLSAWWDLHPREFPEVTIHGRVVRAPRWQQAYVWSYRFSGRVNEALPVPALVERMLEWAKREVDTRLNGILLNWYDAALKHYIGPHRDKTSDLIVGAPIVMISLGAERVFRVRAWRGAAVYDFPVRHGTVLVMPYPTNLAFTHEVQHRARDRGRRISVTMRAFKAHAPRARRVGASTVV